MSDIIKNTLIGMVFFSGLLAFVFGDFILSSVLFAIAATTTNINKSSKPTKPKPYQGNNHFSRSV